MRTYCQSVLIRVLFICNGNTRTQMFVTRIAMWLLARLAYRK